jgi:hypothetical protein
MTTMWTPPGRRRSSEPRPHPDGHHQDHAHEQAAAGAGAVFDRIAGAFEGHTDTTPGPVLIRLWGEQCAAIRTRPCVCVHLMTSRPVPVVAAAWRPGWAVCHACAPVLALPREDPRGRQCDGCLREAPTHAAALHAGVIVFIATMCAECTTVDVMGAGERP